MCRVGTQAVGKQPLDGLTNPAQLSQLSSRWSSVVFDIGGNYSVCYSYNNTFAHIPVTISVYGALSSENMVYCRFKSTAACTGSISLFGMVTGKAALVPIDDGECGKSTLASVFESISAPVSGNFVFDFGAKLQLTTQQSFKVCLCPDYEATYTGAAGPCTDSPINFVQSAGTLILISAVSRDPEIGNEISVVSHVKFNLEIVCGSGGCSQAGGRIKIVEGNASNRVPYYSERAGCVRALQSSGYIGPSNCQSTSPTACSLSPSNGLIFENIQLDGTKFQDYDICYCDSNCGSRSNWFFVDTIQVKPTRVSFTVGGSVVPRPLIGMKGSIEISVDDEPTSFRSNGTLSREMKLLLDNSLSLTSHECFSNPQSVSVVIGHDCYTVSNCATPTTSSKRRLVFGADDIRIQQAGYISVCYCNSECTVWSNWFVAGRLLLSGPSPGQSWTVTQSLPFSVSIRGWGLATSDRIQMCTTTSNWVVSGPTDLEPKILSGSAVIVNIQDAWERDVSLAGTVVQFDTPHQLFDGDWIQLMIGFPVLDNTNHRVSVLDDASILLSISLPINWRIDVPLTAARWWRTNVETFSSLVATKPGNYSLCWNGIFFLGPLMVVAPPFTVGTLGLGTIVPDKACFVSLQFSTSDSTAYAVDGGYMRIVFSALNLLEPLDRNGNSLSGDSTECGSYFLEMNSLGGFSYPSNCSAIGNPKNDLSVHFNEGNGLRGEDVYTFVLMGKAFPGLSPVNPPNGPVQVWTMNRDGTVIEVVYLKPNRGVSPLVGSNQSPRVSFDILDGKNSFDLASTSIALTGFCLSSCSPCSSDSECGTSGSPCISPIPPGCAKGNITAYPSFRFMLPNGVIPGSTVRVIFSPLNDWNLQSNVLVTCSSLIPPILSTVTESLVNGPLTSDNDIVGGNVLSITLPGDLDPMTPHVYSVGSVRLPRNGFFSEFFWAEIVPPDLEVADPIYVRSSVGFYKRPSISMASLYVPSPLIFRGDNNTLVYLKLELGVRAAYTAAITVQMPKGYTCKMEMVAGCDVKRYGTRVCEFDGITPPSLPLFTTRPSGRGLLGIRTSEREFNQAGWTQDTNACILTLKTDTVVFSSSSIFFAILVDVPPTPLQRSAWSVFLLRDGILSATKTIAGNVAVLGELGNASFHPSTLVANEWNNVLVSFTTESACNGPARIVIETNGDPSCDFWGLDRSFSCLEPGVIVSSNSLLPKTNVAFTILLRNPERSPSMWFRVRTESRPGEGCDATFEVIQFAIYPEQLDGLNVTVSDMTPGSVSSVVRIAPIRVPVQSRGSIRITAPVGFIWNFSSNFFRFRFSGIDPLPIGSIPVPPIREPLNVLVIDNLVSPMLPGKSYGIEATVSVPLTSPSSNFFRIEVGSVAAAVVRAPLVKTIRNAAVEMETTIARESGLICFQFETVTDLVRTSQIVIEFPSSFSTKMDCFLISKTNSTSLLPPRDAICYFDSKKSLLSVTAGKGGIPRGRLNFCLSFTNPSTSSDGGRWRIYSLASNGRDYMDYPAIIAAERITKRIGGGLEVGAFSNRRPGASGNKLLFWFIADASDQSRNTTISVKAPIGFSFRQNCSIDPNVNASFAQWPTLTFSSQCGTREAVFYSSSPLVGTSLYGLYVTGIENPIESSPKGTWSLSINGNCSTGPIPGFDLWSFRGLKLISRDLSRGAENVTVQLQFVVTSSIPPYGSILITTPSAGFTFPSPLCSASSLQVPVICTSYPLLPIELNLTLPAGLIAGSLTEFVFTVNNPPSVQTSNLTGGSWKIASYNVSGEALDVGTYLGPKIVDPFTERSLLSISTTACGDPTIVELKLLILIGTVGDTVEVQFPLGYVLNAPGSSKCTATIEGGRCNGNTITFPVTNGPLTFSVVTRNPSSTPRINTYIARHLRGPTVMAFGSFNGPLLIPKIENIEIEFSAVSAGSLSRVIISFTRLALHGDRIRISGHDMSQVTSSLPILSKSQSDVLLNATSLGTLQVCRIELINVRLPPFAGRSVWSLAVLEVQSILQKSDNVIGPNVVGRIDVVTSSVSPNHYGSLDSVIEFGIKLVGSQLSKGDQLRLYPPSGYIYGDNSEFFFDSDSLNMESFSIHVSLPRRMDKAEDRRWRFDLVSPDQELVATNDNSFPGFWLTSSLPFQVIPSSTSPSVRSDLRVVFTVPFEIRLATKSISLQLIAPNGFVFSSAISCLSIKTSQWPSCVGSGNVATIASGSLVIPAGVGEIVLVVLSPVSTPSTENNLWNISIYIDDDPELIVSSDSAAGYPVKAMQAAFIGSNRLGISRVAFFTFRLSQIPKSFFQVLIQPPPDYTVLCDSTYHVGMKSAPICSGNDDGVPGSSVTVIVPKTEVSSVQLYAIGVTVVYPASRPRSKSFSLIIQDSLGATLDANTHVDGPVLDQVYVLGPSMTYSSSRPRSLSTVTVSFSVEVAFNPSSIVLQGPDNYILGAATNVKLSTNFHMTSVAVKGNMVTILLTSKKGLEVDTFTLSLTVMNPGTTPYNNFWVLSIFRDNNTVYYSAPMEGYLINSLVI